MNSDFINSDLLREELSRLQQVVAEQASRISILETEAQKKDDQLIVLQDLVKLKEQEADEQEHLRSRGEALFNSLLNNVPDYIYFKDENSRFLRNSLSHIKLFGARQQSEIIGKCDADFFPDHASNALRDEQNIIKTGKPILNVVESETWPDGHITYVTTSKFPLKDAQGNILGTFGISKDITVLKELEIELRFKNDELTAVEEELRQNLEELQTVQDDLLKQKIELERSLHELKNTNDELDEERYLMDSLMAYIPDYIYFKDRDCKFIRNTLSHIKLFKLEKQDDLKGKSDFDFFPKHAANAFKDEQKIIETGIPILNKVEEEHWPDGHVTYVSTSKMPLYDKARNIVGTFGISKDITELKEMEIELRLKNDELSAVEEELRQNLEELQTMQEDLLKQKVELERSFTDLKKTNDELDRERYLMDTLMAYIPDYIYFKDKDCKFIRNTLSHIQLFKAEKQEDIIGKSDFDFFPEHAGNAFRDEQRIIETGTPILNKIEEEHWPDGHITYVSTSKMPLYDKARNIVGTFGISKDITQIKTLENSLRKQNEELLAKEAELQLINQELQQQKEEIITQRDAIELINKQLEKTNATVVFQNEQIKSSIRYAKTIQAFILPTREVLGRYFENFIIYKPKDIVSGDYYWLNTVKSNGEEQIVMAVVDCTGHGVPGAIMSMVSSNFLNHIVSDKKIYSPKDILTLLDFSIRKALRQDETHNQDGVDISLVLIAKDENGAKIVFSGAKNSLFYYSASENKLGMLQADKKSIGGVLSRSKIEFTNTEIELHKGDLVYLLTDGFIDQNNVARTRFSTKRLLNLLEENALKPLDEQKETLESELERWMDGTEQRDDITLLGIRI